MLFINAYLGETYFDRCIFFIKCEVFFIMGLIILNDITWIIYNKLFNIHIYALRFMQTNSHQSTRNTSSLITSRAKHKKMKLSRVYMK